MADDSLDDFFAKKDKSKKKSKSKIKPDDILAQQDAPSSKTKKKKSKTPKETEGDGEHADKAKKEDDEWKEIEEEQEVDLSGLRIKEMQVSKDEEVDEEEDQGEEEGEGSEKKEGGPWKQVAEGAKPLQEEARKTPDPVPQETPAVETPKPTTGKYIPPSKRGAAGGEQAGQVITPNPLAGGRRKKKEAPNLRSEQDFPTLGGGAMGAESGGQFEEVRVGGRQAEDPTKQRHKLQLDNKFGALEDNDS